MIGIFNTIKIAGTEFPRPSDFEIKREDVLAGEYTTLLGETRADRIGWKFSDTEIKFDLLPDTLLSVLTSLSGEFEIEFTDSDKKYTETAIRKSFSNIPTAIIGDGGAAMWKDVSVEVTFINVHTD